MTERPPTFGYSLACPFCHAAAGRGCVTAGGGRARRPHKGRARAAGIIDSIMQIALLTTLLGRTDITGVIAAARGET